MLPTRTSIQYRDGTAAIAPIIVAVDGSTGELSAARERLVVEQAIDDVLADSFPASDPPSWNPGVARPVRVAGAVGRDGVMVAATDADRADSAAAVSRLRSAERTVLQGLVSLAGAVGIVLLVPFAILLVGLPVVLAARGVFAAVGWLFGIAFS